MGIDTDLNEGPLRTMAHGRVLEATLHGPPDNRLTANTLTALGRVLDRYESDPRLRVLIVRGAGSVFSKGFDLSPLRSAHEPGTVRSFLVLANGLFTRLARCSKPTIGAIDGACLGGGLELALACHFRLCSSRSRLGFPEIWMNLVPGLGGATRLAAVVGRSKALEFVALGDIVSAEEALRLNLATRVFSREGFVAGVKAFVDALQMGDAAAMTESLRLFPPNDGESLYNAMEAFERLARSWTPRSS